MIITLDEINQTEDFLEKTIININSDDEAVECPPEPVFFANYPHLLMLLGFDEFRAIPVDAEKKAPISEPRNIPYVPFALFQFPYELFYRKNESGAWAWFDGITHYSYSHGKSNARKGEYYLHFVNHKDEHLFFPVSQWLKQLNHIAVHHDPNPHTLFMPQIWAPSNQLSQNIELVSIIPALLQAIQTQKRDLRDIPWRHLEEIVAELLRSRGLEVFVTPRTHDGGRDIVARGELILGEPTLLAVEVKQKTVVSIEDVQRALRANEDFPALLVATAGRFSGGVIKEKARHRNQLRLLLKDGIALTQWIGMYKSKS